MTNLNINSDVGDQPYNLAELLSHCVSFTVLCWQNLKIDIDLLSIHNSGAPERKLNFSSKKAKNHTEELPKNVTMYVSSDTFWKYMKAAISLNNLGML